MPELTNQPLPSGPHTLCFNKEDFTKDDFNVEHFVVECRRKVSLEMLRGDLNVYLKILQSAMIELINKDYADFVNLSSNLVGMDRAINNLLNPLSHLKLEILNVRSSMVEAASAVEDKLKQQARIREKKDCLKTLMNIIQSLEKMEMLLGISDKKEEEQKNFTRELNGQLIERVATEFNRLQFHVSKSSGLPLVEEIKPRISNITMMLQYSLEGSFKEGLLTGNIEILRDCLRTYSTIDKMRDAENLFRTFVVKGYMEEVINEQFIRSHPIGLQGMFNSILDFFPKHCSKLNEVTFISRQSSNDIVTGYDFVVNSVWPEVVANLEARTPSIFAPGNPNIFHERYLISLGFIEGFERQCHSQASVKRLRSHLSYNTFMSKWSLPVYFQIRFQEIAGALESALFTPFVEATGKTNFYLHSSSVLWECLLRCWAKDIFLEPLCHRFWKLSLQLLSRFSLWISDVHDELKRAASVPRTESLSSLQNHHGMKSGNGDNSMTLTFSTSCLNSLGTPSASVSLTNAVSLIADSQTLAGRLTEFFDATALPPLSRIDNINISVLRESLTDSQDLLLQHIPQFEIYITTEIASQCSSHLRSVSDIPRLYRRTNREVPNKASSYVMNTVKPLLDFLNEHQSAISPINRHKWTISIFQSIAEQFLLVTTDVLTSVKKMEESLKRLKAARGTSATGGNQGMTDDDKIRLQLTLDVKEFGQQVVALQIKETDVPLFEKLQEVVSSGVGTVIG